MVFAHLVEFKIEPQYVFIDFMVGFVVPQVPRYKNLNLTYICSIGYKCLGSWCPCASR